MSTREILRILSSLSFENIFSLRFMEALDSKEIDNKCSKRYYDAMEWADVAAFTFVT